MGRKKKQELIQFITPETGKPVKAEELIALDTQLKAHPNQEIDLWRFWWQNAAPVVFVRFHAPVPRAPKAEPVTEFKLITTSPTDTKYKVDEMRLHPMGILWKTENYRGFSPQPNVVYSWV